MVAERLGVLLDAKRRRKLAAVAARRGVSMTAVLGELIDRAYEATAPQPQLGSPPGPEELARRQAQVATILKRREARRIAPLSSADLVHQAREEAGLAHGHDH